MIFDAAGEAVGDTLTVEVELKSLEFDLFVESMSLGRSSTGMGAGGFFSRSSLLVVLRSLNH